MVDEISYCRAQGLLCRILAERSRDATTAANLKLLARHYEGEARRAETETAGQVPVTSFR